MVDVFQAQKRSDIMRRIRSRDTIPERTVRSWIHSMRYRFRLQGRDLPGNPDIVLPKHRKVIFVHGCFWHGGHRGCKRASIPATNHAFWKKKIEDNKHRDRMNYRRLKRLGWGYLVIWQCQLAKAKEPVMRERLKAFIAG
jgi:DNA mismatch endonuclease, patch repair protein